MGLYKYRKILIGTYHSKRKQTGCKRISWRELKFCGYPQKIITEWYNADVDNNQCENRHQGERLFEKVEIPPFQTNVRFFIGCNHFA